MLLQLTPSADEKMASLGYDLQTKNPEFGQEMFAGLIVAILGGSTDTSVMAYSDGESPTGFNALKTAYGL